MSTDPSKLDIEIEEIEASANKATTVMAGAKVVIDGIEAKLAAARAEALAAGATEAQLARFDTVQSDLHSHSDSLAESIANVPGATSRK